MRINLSRRALLLDNKQKRVIKVSGVLQHREIKWTHCLHSLWMESGHELHINHTYQMSQNVLSPRKNVYETSFVVFFFFPPTGIMIKVTFQHQTPESCDEFFREIFTDIITLV